MFYLIVNSIYHLNFKTYVHWDITRLMGSGAINVRRGPIEHLFACLLAVWTPKSRAHFLLGHLNRVWMSLCLDPLESPCLDPGGGAEFSSIPYHLWLHLGPPEKSVILCG